MAPSSLPLDLPNLIRLQLDGNKLKGQISSFNLPEVKEFNIRFNSFIGPFPNIDMPALERLHIEGNNITRLPDFTGVSGALWDISCYLNKLHFDDLLPYKDINRFEYGAMQPVDMLSVVIGDSIQLSVNVRGNGNVYTWYNQSWEHCRHRFKCFHDI